MTTKDKKRILATPTVSGEIGIRKADGGFLWKYKFRDISKINERYVCVVISKSDYNTDTDHIQPEKNGVEIWNTGYGRGYMKQIIPYKNVEILWAHYTTNTNQIN